MSRERLYRQFVAEEVAAALRHTVVNKVTAVGALNFHLKRQIAAAALPTAISSVPPLIDAELAQASAGLNLRFLAATTPGQSASVAAAIAAAVDALGRPAAAIEGDPALRAAIDAGELELAITCLLENAVEAGGAVSIRSASAPPHALIDILDGGPGLPDGAHEPFFTSRPGRLGLGLNVTTRIALRWGGSLELRSRQRPPGTQARLTLPLVAP